MRLGVRVKYSFDELAVQPDGFEDLRAAVALLRGDAHLGHHFQQPLADRLDDSSFRSFSCVNVSGR